MSDTELDHETLSEPEEDSSSKPSGKPKGHAKSALSKRLTPRERIEAIGLAKDGIPVAKIAHMFGVTPPAIYRLLKDRGIKIGVYSEKAAEVARAEERKKLVEKIKQTKDFNFRSINWIKQEMMRELIQAKAAGKSAATAQDALKTYKMAAEILRLGQEVDWKVLGLDKENEHADTELPELPIRELQNHEIEALRDQQTLEDMITEGGSEEPEITEEDEGEEPEDFVKEWGGGHDGPVKP